MLTLTLSSGMPSSSASMSASEFDGHAGLPDLAGRQRVVAVVADLRRQVEGHAQPGLALAEQVLETLVGLSGRAIAGVLAHGPEAAAVHGRLHAAGEGVLAGETQLLQIRGLRFGGRRLGTDVERRAKPLERLRFRPFWHALIDRPDRWIPSCVETRRMVRCQSGSWISSSISERTDGSL